MRTKPITFEGGTSTDDISTAVVEAVAAEAGVDATELPPLYEWIDPDALDALFAPRPTGLLRTGTIDFSYHEYLVTVSFDAELEITLADRTTR